MRTRSETGSDASSKNASACDERRPSSNGSEREWKNANVLTEKFKWLMRAAAAAAGVTAAPIPCKAEMARAVAATVAKKASVAMEVWVSH